MTNDLIQKLRGALADIAFSDDMTLKVARAKAKRVYEETASGHEPSSQWGGVEKLAEQRNGAYRALEQIREKLGGICPADFKSPDGETEKRVEAAYYVADNLLQPASQERT